MSSSCTYIPGSVMIVPYVFHVCLIIGQHLRLVLLPIYICVWGYPFYRMSLSDYSIYIIKSYCCCTDCVLWIRTKHWEYASSRCHHSSSMEISMSLPLLPICMTISILDQICGQVFPPRQEIWEFSTDRDCYIGCKCQWACWIQSTLCP